MRSFENLPTAFTVSHRSIRSSRDILPSHTLFFQAEDGIRDLRMSRGLGDVYKRQVQALLSGMRSGVGAVIVSVVWDMGSGIVKQKKIAPILIMLCAFIANYYLKINIVLIILICIILAAAKAIITERRRSHK